jgi:shikimate 5-dehydrogenase
MIEIGSNGRPGQQLCVVVGAGGMAMAVARRLGASYRILLADRDSLFGQTPLKREGTVVHRARLCPRRSSGA